jgi:hypothetical protein
VVGVYIQNGEVSVGGYVYCINNFSINVIDPDGREIL